MGGEVTGERRAMRKWSDGAAARDKWQKKELSGDRKTERKRKKMESWSVSKGKKMRENEGGERKKKHWRAEEWKKRKG